MEAILTKIGEIISKLVGNIIEWITTFMNNMWALVLFILGMFWALLSYITSAIDIGIDYLTLAFAKYGQIAFQVNDYYRFANCWVPFGELFACLSIFLGVLVVTTIYRFFKSWLPTLS